ncbi:MAG: hypothetical protein GXP14_11400 [Gammaproteobacteria bacterium]|nr:hypothetical protein [Gammaproteobacteria bacterium]
MTEEKQTLKQERKVKKDELECCDLYGEYCYPCPPQESPETNAEHHKAISTKE